MKLGLGLIAADQYFKEGDARVLRDQQRERFGWDKQRAESELSILPDKTEADRTGYQARAGQNRADIELQPAKTQNAKARLGMDAADLQGEADRKPDEIKTKGINAKIGLDTAQNTQNNLPQSLQVANNNLQSRVMTSDAAVKQLPAKLQQLAVQGVLNGQGQSDVVFGTLGQLISRKDKAGAIAFANEISKQGSVLPETNGKPLRDIVDVSKGQYGAPGDGYLFVTQDGQAHFAPVEKISGAMNKLKSGKYHFIHTPDGSVYSGNESTGAITQAFKGNPKVSSMGDRRPREIQLFEFYKGLGYGENDALSKVKELGHKSRQQFEADSLKDALAMAQGATPDEKAQNAYTMVKKAADLVYGGQALGTTHPNQKSNTLGSGTFDPTISSLIGIP